MNLALFAPSSRRFVATLILCTLLLLFASAFWRSLKFGAFKQIKLGMEKERVSDILREHGIECEQPLMWYFNPSVCRFSDYYREYGVAFARPDGAGRPYRVSELVVRYKEPGRILFGGW